MIITITVWYCFNTPHSNRLGPKGVSSMGWLQFVKGTKTFPMTVPLSTCGGPAPRLTVSLGAAESYCTFTPPQTNRTFWVHNRFWVDGCERNLQWMAHLSETAVNWYLANTHSVLLSLFPHASRPSIQNQMQDKVWLDIPVSATMGRSFCVNPVQKEMKNNALWYYNSATVARDRSHPWVLNENSIFVS